jgi:hypothetical protein
LISRAIAIPFLDSLKEFRSFQKLY